MAEENKTILVVDDDIDVLKALDRRLSHVGFVVLTASNGMDALELAAEQRIHAITLDVNLPGELDGLALANILRKQSHTARVPIVFITGAADGGFKRKCEGAGGDYFLAKPYDADLLIRTIQGIFAADELGRLQQLSQAKRRQPTL